MLFILFCVCFVLADIQGSCATVGDGLYEGLDWLKSTITQQRLGKSVTKPVNETIVDPVKTTLSSLEKDSYIKSLWTSVSSYFVRD